MPREIHLNGVVADEDRVPVTIGEGEQARHYRLRPMTRDLRKKVNAVELKVDKIKESVEGDADLDRFYDDLVDVFLEGVDVLLEVDNTGESKHRTPASKTLRAGYQENHLSWATIANYYAELRDEAESTRPI